MKNNYHQLFSEDGDNNCLYCLLGKCAFTAGDGNWTPTLGAYFVDKYTCQSCGETFGVHYIYPINRIMGFEFSCQDLVMLHHYQNSTIKVARKDNLQEVVEIPAFDCDCADKDALYQKIRLCLTFA